MNPTPDEESHGGFVWRLARVEGEVDRLARRVDEQYKDLQDAGSKRHEENRNRLEKIGEQLSVVTNDNHNLKSQVARSAAIGGAIFVGVMIVVILAVLKFVGPALGSIEKHIPEEQQDGHTG